MATKMVKVPLVGGSTFGIDPKISGRKIYNYFVTDAFLYSTPGWKKRLTLVDEADTPIAGRGIFKSDRGDVAIAVVNQTVWSLDAVTGQTFVGNLDSFSNLVSIDENLNGQICIVDGISAYIYNRYTRALTKQSMPDWLTPNFVCFQNTYFLIGNADRTGNGGRWGIFIYEAENTIEFLQEGALQSKPDYARAVVRVPGKSDTILVFGENVTEVQTDVGGLQVYARVPTLNIDYGVANVATIAYTDNFVCWLAINEFSPPVIMYSNGEQHQTISTDGINYLLDKVVNPQKSLGFFFKRAGHLFYNLTLYDERDNFSLLYDFNTKLFSFTSDADLNYHPAVKMIYANGTNYFVSLNNGALYETSLDFTTYDENVSTFGHPSFRLHKDRIIPRQIVGDTFVMPAEASDLLDFPSPYTVLSFSVRIKQGAEKDYSQAYAEEDLPGVVITEEGSPVLTEDGEYVLTENPVSNIKYEPAVDFSFSMDGAETWSSEVRRTMHFVGKRKNLMQWDSIGYMNEMTHKLKVWSYGSSVVENGAMLIMM